MSGFLSDLDLSMLEQKKEEQRHKLLVGLVTIFTNTQTIIYLNLEFF